MREIKFRGKHQDTGEWLYGVLCISSVHDPNICWVDEELVVIDTPIIRPDTIGQFTGLKDGNRKEVYEGDIVMTYVLFVAEEEMQREFWRVGEVRFITGGFHLTNCTNYDDCRMEEKSDIQPSPKSTFSFPAYRSEVIGNVFDNPILINK